MVAELVTGHDDDFETGKSVVMLSRPLHGVCSEEKCPISISRVTESKEGKPVDDCSSISGKPRQAETDSRTTSERTEVIVQSKGKER